jgi:hypothetical protein
MSKPRELTGDGSSSAARAAGSPTVAGSYEDARPAAQAAIHAAMDARRLGADRRALRPHHPRQAFARIDGAVSGYLGGTHCRDDGDHDADAGQRHEDDEDPAAVLDHRCL